jgi:neutral amino acid transport system permease protein
MGKATRAVSDNADLAAASGINVDQVIRVVWIMAGGLAGLAGILWAYFRPGLKWDMGEKSSSSSSQLVFSEGLEQHLELS